MFGIISHVTKSLNNKWQLDQVFGTAFRKSGVSDEIDGAWDDYRVVARGRMFVEGDCGGITYERFVRGINWDGN